MKNIKLVLVATLILITTGCSSIGSKDEVITVYSTSYPIKYIVGAIGGEYVNSYGIYDNTDEISELTAKQKTDSSVEIVEYHAEIPADGKITDKKITDVLNADIFIINQLEHETTAVEQVLESDNSKDLEIVDVTEYFQGKKNDETYPLIYNGTNVSSDITSITESSFKSPYFWISPLTMITVSENIKDLLIEKAPQHTQEFQNNYETLRLELLGLDASLVEIIDSTENNVIVSNSRLLDILDYHSIKNITTSTQYTYGYENDEDNSRYLNDLSNYITINSNQIISTTNPDSSYYFDPLFVLSDKDVSEGQRFVQVMKNNYLILDSVLKN